MAKIKLTKNELKKQKDGLKMFKRYLPTLMLKKQQLQMEIRKIEQRKKDVEGKIEQINNEFKSWIAVFGEDAGLNADLIKVKHIHTETSNIAGVDIPVFKEAEFFPVTYDLFEKPLWVDKAVEKLKTVVLLDLELKVLEEQVKLLGDELRITTQRVNLFEKVKIPETNNNIKNISVYLGDQQTVSVVRGKISKNKLVKVA